MRNRGIPILALVLIAAAPYIASIASAQTVVLTHVEIPPLTGLTFSSDGADIDQTDHRLYLTDRTVGGSNGIAVFDVSTPTAKYLGEIGLAPRSSGLVVGDNIRRVFVGLADSTIGVIDIDSSSPTYNMMVAAVSTGGQGRVDLVGYDPVDKKVYGANNGEGFLSVMDATTNQYITSFPDLGDNLEVPAYNPVDGMVYFTASGRNILYQIDPKTDQMVAAIDIKDACYPNGFAINPNTNQALLGCSSREGYRHVALWDFATQSVTATSEAVGSGDLVVYDPVVDRYFFGAAHTADDTTVMAIFSGSPFAHLMDVPIGGNAPMFDQANRVVYSADVLPGEASLWAFQLP